MTESGNTSINVDMTSEDLSPFHQDGFQGTQKRILTVFPHLADSGSEWNCYISVGMATDEQKAPLVDEIAQARSPLNDKYFLGAENLELWIDNHLAGLCRCRLQHRMKRRRWLLESHSWHGFTWMRSSSAPATNL